MRYIFLILIGASSFIACEHFKPRKDIRSVQSEIPQQETIDTLLKKELEQILVEDQTLRLMLPDVAEKFGSGSIEEKYIWSLIHQQDSICIIEVTDMLDKYGWLGKNRVGSKANQAIWLVIQHAELETQEKYLPLLKESVTIGESEGWHMAFFKDRILMRKKKNQIYGTQATWDKTTNKMKIYPIEDVKSVNRRREKLGLESIEEYANMNGYIFDQDE